MLLKDKKGFTLVELIVAIAIIGIISVFVLSAFSSGVKIISKARFSSAAGYNTQSIVEDDLKNSSITTNNITITLPGSPSSTIMASGTISTKSAVVNGETVTITYFKPGN